MEECVMCCEHVANCKLICKHSFCKSCVKTWYLKCKTEPTCPNCRHKLYFKGMYKMVKVWEEEAETLLNEEAFNEAVDYVMSFNVDSELDEEETSESDEEETDSFWDSDENEDQTDTFDDRCIELVQGETREILNSLGEDTESECDFSEFFSSEIISDLIRLQDRYHKALKYGLDIPGVLENDWYWATMRFGMEYDYTEDDIFPHTKKLFISNHKDTNIRKRTSKRIPPKADASETLIFYIEMSV